jgi:hypothetical protein
MSRIVWIQATLQLTLGLRTAGFAFRAVVLLFSFWRLEEEFSLQIDSDDQQES